MAPPQLIITPADVRVHGHVSAEAEHIISPHALRFLAFLHQNFEMRRRMLLQYRVTRQMEFDAGVLPDFNPATKAIREDSTWRVVNAPTDLQDRRVEITGPVDRKMVINGLNSGASTYMADFEDSTAPTFANILDGQANLRDAVRRTISLVVTAGDGKQKHYRLNDKPAVLLVRPRGWHLEEAHITVDGQAMSASLVDFGLYLFHNSYALLQIGSGPYYYLPKMENHLEARLWNDVFVASQAFLGIPKGTIRATALLETITAAFEMEEMLYELREHSTGLNCGRWDYMFSYIKKLRADPSRVTPDRSYLTMQCPFMEAYVELLIHTCHKRGAHAMGGMAAQIPVKNDPEKQEKAMAQVKADKLREVKAGHDGTWVAHPALVKVAMDIFNEHMPQPNQLNVIPECHVTAADLLEAPKEGDITVAGLQENVQVCLEYVESWIRGTGCIPLHHKMEDAATAEISRVQVWQWLRHGAKARNGTMITKELVAKMVTEETSKLRGQSGGQAVGRRFPLAGALVKKMMLADELDDFLTSVAYPFLVDVQCRM